MTFDQLVAENDAVLEQGDQQDHADMCSCPDCTEERHDNEDELRAADLEYERITR